MKLNENHIKKIKNKKRIEFEKYTVSANLMMKTNTVEFFYTLRLS